MGPNWGKIKGQEWAKYAKNKGPRWVALAMNVQISFQCTCFASSRLISRHFSEDTNDRLLF